LKTLLIRRNLKLIFSGRFFSTVYEKVIKRVINKNLFIQINDIQLIKVLINFSTNQ